MKSILQLIFLLSFGLTATAQSIDFQVYPNPFIDTIHVQSQGIVNDSIDIKIYGITGAIVSHPIDSQWVASDTAFTLNLDTLPDQVFFMHISILGTQAQDTLIRIIKDQTTSTNDFEAQNPSFTTYPNPTTDYVTVEFGKSSKNVELILTDMYGKLISTKHYDDISKTDIELGEAAGIYFLTIKTDSNINTIQLIKN